MSAEPIKPIPTSAEALSELDAFFANPSIREPVRRQMASARAKRRPPADLTPILEPVDILAERLLKILDAPSWIPTAYILRVTINTCQRCHHQSLSTDGLYLKSRNRRNPTDFKLEFIPDSEGEVLPLMRGVEHSSRLLPGCHHCWELSPAIAEDLS